MCWALNLETGAQVDIQKSEKYLLAFYLLELHKGNFKLCCRKRYCVISSGYRLEMILCGPHHAFKPTTLFTLCPPRGLWVPCCEQGPTQHHRLI